jgi:dipeptidyl-peptidase 4
VSTKAYRLRRCWNHFIRHLAGAQPPTYRISDIPLDLKALTEALAV